MRSVLYIERNSIYYYGGDTKQPLSVGVTAAALADNELISHSTLTTQLQNFFTASKVVPNSTVIFFSSKSCFQKAIPGNLKPEQELSLKNSFLDQVPFNHVLEKTYTASNNTQVVVAVNKDLAYFLRDVLLKSKFQVEGIVPGFALFGDQQNNFNINIAQEIIKHFSLLQKVSFPIFEQESQIQQEFSSNSEDNKESNSRLYIMIAVFAVLIVILVAVYAISRKPKTTSNNILPTKQTAAVPSRTKKQEIIIPTATPLPTQYLAPKNSLKIRVLNGSGIVGQADSIRAKLEAEEYENIEVGNVPTQSAEKSLVVVRPNVPIMYRENLQAILSANNIDSIVRINSEIDVDVLITTYQSTN